MVSFPVSGEGAEGQRGAAVMEHDEFAATLDELNEEFDHPIVVGFVIIVDVMDTEGNRWLSHRTSEGMPSWQRDGMLQSVLSFQSWEDEDDWDE